MTALNYYVNPVLAHGNIKHVFKIFIVQVLFEDRTFDLT